jgi:hypothetical protein
MPNISEQESLYFEIRIEETYSLFLQPTGKKEICGFGVFDIQLIVKYRDVTYNL